MAKSGALYNKAIVFNGLRAPTAGGALWRNRRTQAELDLVGNQGTRQSSLSQRPYVRQIFIASIFLVFY
jgi:hypothetical protein